MPITQVSLHIEVPEGSRLRNIRAARREAATTSTTPMQMVGGTNSGFIDFGMRPLPFHLFIPHARSTVPNKVDADPY